MAKYFITYKRSRFGSIIGMGSFGFTAPTPLTDEELEQFIINVKAKAETVEQSLDNGECTVFVDGIFKVD